MTVEQWIEREQQSCLDIMNKIKAENPWAAFGDEYLKAHSRFIQLDEWSLHLPDAILHCEIFEEI